MVVDDDGVAMAGEGGCGCADSDVVVFACDGGVSVVAAACDDGEGAVEGADLVGREGDVEGVGREVGFVVGTEAEHGGRG